MTDVEVVVRAGLLCCLSLVAASAFAEETDGGYAGHLLSKTRLLRRMQFSVLGRPPTDAEVARVKAATTDAESDAELARILDEDLASTAFYEQLVRVGRDFLRMGPYSQGYVLTYFSGFQAGELRKCGTSSQHAGALGTFAGYSDRHGGDPLSICDDTNAPIATIEPWWAPGTTVRVIGRAGTQLRSNGPNDCGLIDVSPRSNVLRDTGANPCSCGPNLIYCWTTPSDLSGVPQEAAGVVTVPHTPRRQAWEEGSRLFAHVGWHDRSMTDLVAGNYSVAPLMLRFMYLRSGRMNPANGRLDDSDWWKPSTWSAVVDPLHQPGDPLAWTEFVPHALNPQMLSLTANDSVSTGQAAIDRKYAFDPRVQTGEPEGMPSAGVLTTWSALGIFPRERVRGARWLEVFACRDFIPPTQEQAAQLGTYLRDPATEGVCQHCHVSLDPASIFFKRWGFGGGGQTSMGGVGPWKFTTAKQNANPYHRWKGSFVTDTVLTPVTQAQLMDNPDAMFLDFQPADAPTRFKLFGQESDGTIGPLGFSKQLISSGTFDRCFTQRMYEAFVGVQLDRNADNALIAELVASFKAKGRKLKPFVRELLMRPEVRRGW